MRLVLTRPVLRRCARSLLAVALWAGTAATAHGQAIAHRGFIEGAAFVFPVEERNDPTHLVGDLLAREEVSLRPAKWLLVGAGVDFRANTDDQVQDSWELDWDDRGSARPRLSIRRLAATLTRGRLTLEVGKQFVRWGKTDVVVPTDRFAPRDFLTVIDAPYLAITALRGTVQAGSHTLEAVWSPRLTPSRLPLLGQRWAVLPSTAPSNLWIVEAPVAFPSRGQAGLRYGQIRDRFEYSLSFYDGFNHLPELRFDEFNPSSATIALTRVYPPLRSYGADAAVPLPWFTLKTEAAYFTSSSPSTDEYLLYVVQVERQIGEWLLIGGYAGEVVTKRRSPFVFAPDRGVSRAFLGRSTYTIDGNRSVELEAAVRYNGDGVYVKAEYSQAYRQHWRAIVSGVALAGDTDDFIGQYRRNSYLRFLLRYSF
ncbi:MAG: hypothetical protein WBC51_01030 [Vicinamibacterales bacterium]